MVNNKNNLLIVGLDPGTTTAYACLDLNGSIASIGSSKEFSFGALLAKISQTGLPVLVCGDKKNTPSLVKNFAAKTGARIVKHQHDMLSKEKSELTSSLNYSNAHEMDALASALFAFKKNRELISRLNKFIIKYGKGHIAADIGKLVLAYGMPIRTAAELLEPETKQKITAKEQPKIKTYPAISNIASLIEKNSALKQKIIEINNKNRQFIKEIRQLNAKLESICSTNTKALQKEKAKQGLAFKQKTIRSLSKKLMAQEKQILCMKQGLAALYFFFDDMDNYVIIKIIENLGSNALDIKSLKNDRILYVKNPSVYSKNTVEQLRKKVSILIADRPPAFLKKFFSVIDAGRLRLTKPEIISGYYFAMKKDIGNELSRCEMLNRIISDYKENKS